MEHRPPPVLLRGHMTRRPETTEEWVLAIGGAAVLYLAPLAGAAGAAWLLSGLG